VSRLELPQKARLLIALAAGGSTPLEEARTAAMQACRILWQEICDDPQPEAAAEPAVGPPAFWVLQGRLGRRGRNLHISRTWPSDWNHKPHRVLCGLVLDRSPGASMMEVRGRRTWSEEVFLAWPTATVCPKCASLV
jgi:hypothetical protein